MGRLASLTNVFDLQLLFFMSSSNRHCAGTPPICHDSRSSLLRFGTVSDEDIHIADRFWNNAPTILSSSSVMAEHLRRTEINLFDGSSHGRSSRFICTSEKRNFAGGLVRPFARNKSLYFYNKQYSSFSMRKNAVLLWFIKYSFKERTKYFSASLITGSKFLLWCVHGIQLFSTSNRLLCEM